MTAILRKFFLKLIVICVGISFCNVGCTKVKPTILAAVFEKLNLKYLTIDDLTRILEGEKLTAEDRTLLDSLTQKNIYDIIDAIYPSTKSATLSNVQSLNAGTDLPKTLTKDKQTQADLRNNLLEAAINIQTAKEYRKSLQSLRSTNKQKPEDAAEAKAKSNMIHSMFSQKPYDEIAKIVAYLKPNEQVELLSGVLKAKIRTEESKKITLNPEQRSKQIQEELSKEPDIINLKFLLRNAEQLQLNQSVRQRPPAQPLPQTPTRPSSAGFFPIVSRSSSLSSFGSLPSTPRIPASPRVISGPSFGTPPRTGSASSTTPRPPSSQGSASSANPRMPRPGSAHRPTG